ncbi:MAG: 50S ribosomal protein L23 [Candidatus Paceibacterota bacterium]
MGIFNKTKKEEKKTSEETTSVALKTPAVSLHDTRASGVLLDPRITEKATDTAEKNIFVFNVAPSSTKQQIAQSVKEVYNVTPTKIRITKIPRKSIFMKGKKGFTASAKKAYIYLKKGDKIEIV